MSDPNKHPITTELLSTWIRRFTKDDASGNTVAGTWANIISSAFQSGMYSHEEYLSAYKQTFSQKAQGGLQLPLFYFYLFTVLLVTNIFLNQMHRMLAYLVGRNGTTS